MSLNKLLKSFSISKFDLILMGDGSGTGWELPIGFAAMAIWRNPDLRKVFSGCLNHGTIGQAEILPYLTAIRYDYQVIAKGNLEAKRRVIIISDSQVSVNVGNGIQQAHTNKDLWESYKWFLNLGYEITWIWVERNENDIHKLAHSLSNIARKLLTDELKIDPYKILPTEGPYEIDPASEWGF
jgi:hypothetical protein